ncbi:hypothetical protein J6590_088833, partial [Homalodisca vitripennis]
QSLHCGEKSGTNSSYLVTNFNVCLKTIPQTQRENIPVIPCTSGSPFIVFYQFEPNQSSDDA